MRDLINKREQAGIKNLNTHAFIEYSDDMNDVVDELIIIRKIEIKKY